MSSLTVLDLAAELRKPVPEMLTQLRDAGVAVASADSPISPSDKIALLQHLQKMSRMPPTVSATSTLGAASRISIKRKETTELKLGGGRGAPTKTVSIEVRKRRTYLKSDEVEAAEPAPVVAAAAAQLSAVPAVAVGTAAVAVAGHVEPVVVEKTEHAPAEVTIDAAEAARLAVEEAAADRARLEEGIEPGLTVQMQVHPHGLQGDDAAVPGDELAHPLVAALRVGEQQGERARGDVLGLGVFDLVVADAVLAGDEDHAAGCQLGHVDRVVAGA